MEKQRKITRTAMLVAALGVILGASSIQALTVRDFEGIPDQYLYNGGNLNLGDYYPDLYFGPHVVVADRVRNGGYNDALYPPHSGDAVIGTVQYDYMRVDFIGFTPDYVEAWYTCGTDDFYMEAYDASDNMIDNSSGVYNLGSNSLISVSGANIAYVKFHDNGTYFTLDDFAYTPEPATMVLLSLGGMAALRRRRK